MDDHKYGAIEDLLGLTDSEDSSSSSNDAVFESHQPFVLELHDLVKDEPTPENQRPDSKGKKHKKKKKVESKKQASGSSSTLSESSVPPSSLDEHNREEFYDAHESYHGLMENQVPNPVAAAAILQAVSEHGQEPKLVEQQQAATTQQGSASLKDTSAISKPATGPQ